MYTLGLIGRQEQATENPKGVLGIEVVSEFAAWCTLGNICPRQPGGYQGLPVLDPMWYLNDPARDGGDWRFNSAIQLATTCRLPKDGATIVTTQASLESLGAMAVLVLRLEGFAPAPVDRSSGKYFCPVCGRCIEDAVMVQSNSDYYECRNRSCRWREDTGLLNGIVSKRIWAVANGEISPDAKITRATRDERVTLEARVRWMKYWLLTGDEP